LLRSHNEAASSIPDRYLQNSAAQLASLNNDVLPPEISPLSGADPNISEIDTATARNPACAGRLLCGTDVAVHRNKSTLNSPSAGYLR
jgi:hypothetical protein